MLIPLSPEEMTTDWLTAALRSTNTITTETVTTVKFDKPLDEYGRHKGSVAQSYKIELSYSEDIPTAPQSLFVKLSDTNKPEGFRNAYKNEVRFYQEFAADSSLRVPKCYYSDINMTIGAHILLLEDLSNMRSGSVAESASLEEAEQVIISIAKFHASWWDNPVLDDWRTDDDIDRYQVALNFQNFWEACVNKLVEPLTPSQEAIRDRVGESIEYMNSTHRLTPQTLVHFDLHSENLLFPTDGSPIVFIDWQSMQAGRGAVDVTYYLTVCLSADNRREHDMRLLRLYHDTLLANGVSDYSFDTCYRDYCLGIFHFLRVFNIIIYFDMFGSQEEMKRFRDRNLPRLDAFLIDHQIATSLLPEIPILKPRDTSKQPKND